MIPGRSFDKKQMGRKFWIGILGSNRMADYNYLSFPECDDANCLQCASHDVCFECDIGYKLIGHVCMRKYIIAIYDL